MVQQARTDTIYIRYYPKVFIEDFSSTSVNVCLGLINSISVLCRIHLCGGLFRQLF